MAYVTEGLNTATWRYRATVTVHAPAAAVRPRLPAGIRVTPAGRDRCRVEVGADHPEMLALYVGLIGADITVDPDQSPELASALHTLADRYRRAVPTS